MEVKALRNKVHLLGISSIEDVEPRRLATRRTILNSVLQRQAHLRLGSCTISTPQSRQLIKRVAEYALTTRGTTPPGRLSFKAI
jgi:hypothetical protein